MVILHKIEGYILDFENQFITKKDIQDKLNSFSNFNLRLTNSESKEFEWDDGVVINRLNCTDEQYNNFYNSLPGHEIKSNKIQSKILERPNGDKPITLKYLDAEDIYFEYGYVELTTRNWISNPVKTLTFDTVLNISTQLMCRNDGSKYFKLSIMSKKDGELVPELFQDDLANWNVKVIHKGNASINL